MKTARILPLVLAGATLILAGANILPAANRRARLEHELSRLARELRREEGFAARVEAEIEALEGDAFYLERVLAETWRRAPDGALPFETLARD